MKKGKYLLVVTLAALACGLAALTPSCARADTARNWCAEWADGYLIGFCWLSKGECYVPPAMCPYPEDGETDGYMRGLRDGIDSRSEQP